MKYYFLDGTPAQQAKVDSVVQELEHYANITLHNTDDVDDAQIRISFSGSVSWSFYGQDALSVSDPKAPTMMFDDLDVDNATATAIEKGKILHQFGHALGLTHEHLSPTATGGLTMISDGMLFLLAYIGYTYIGKL